jgi:hypothetical protein
MTWTSLELKERFKAAFDEYPESTRIRLHRAISWLRRSEQEVDDPDARFVFQWVAFNAAYARDLEEPTSERAKLNEFLEKLVAVDAGGDLTRLVQHAYPGSIRLLLDNHFVFEPFWRALREYDSSGRWEEQFAASKRAALHHFMAGNTATTLTIVFDRLYVLRNQLVHGGATWSSKLNRQQVKDAAQLMGSLVPAILGIMLANPTMDFGELLYPVVGAT